MKFGLLTLLTAALVVTFCVSPSTALTKFGELSEYYHDYADASLGATITSPSKIHPESELESIITVSNRAHFIFADGIEQREEFTVDLGQVREVGMFIFDMTRSTVYEGELKRKPNSLTVSISTEGPDGPWTQVYKRDPADVTMSFALENVPARWIHYDLGVNTDGIGSRVRRVKIFKRYQLRSGLEIMKEFHTQFKRDAEGLEEFWKAVDAENWEEACDRIIEHYAKWPAEAKGDASPRVAAWMRNEVDDMGCIYQFDSTDWDWFQMKAECAHPTLGGRPGASTILHLLKTAYAATGEEAYAKQLAALLKDWLQDVPCPGVHRGNDGDIVNGWAGIVASQRTWSFGEMVHAMFKDDIYWDRDLKINLLYSLWEHINFMKQVSAELGGNWLTNANSCMFDGAVDYPEFVQYKEWIEASKSYFETSVIRDCFACGREKEDSCMYVPIASNQMTGQYVAMKKAGVAIGPEAQERVDRMWDCFARVFYPDLSLVPIGDAHRDSPLTKNQSAINTDYLEVQDRPDLVFINSMGKEGTAPAEASHGCSICGWYTMRSPWETQPYQDARQMFFKASRHRGHGHRDQLSLTMYAYGREILTDPGNPTYGIPIEREVTKTSVHNTICVDDSNQELAGGRQHAWIATEGLDFVDADSATYKDMMHRRQVLFLKTGKGAPDYWIVRDTVTGEGEHKFDMNYHFSEDAHPQVVDGSVVSTYADGGNAIVRCFDQSVRPDVVDGSISLIQELVPSNIARFTRRQAGHINFETLILPFKGANAPAVKTEYLRLDPECAEADAVGVKVFTENGQDLIVISSEPGTQLSFNGGNLKTDAHVAVIRLDKTGRFVHFFDNGATTSYLGKAL